MKHLTIVFSLILSLSLYSQERVLLRIDKNGQQEAIPLKKGEQAKDVIERIEQRKALYTTADMTWIDTMKYFQTESELTTNFGFTHQDVALQWYIPIAGGVVKEIWWRNYELQGSIKKGTIRAWHLDNRITMLPTNAVDAAGRMGYYDKSNDGDGLVTPFRNEATDTSWKPGSGSNTSIHFDPLASEAKWLPGGLQVTLDSNAWQGITLADWGDSMRIEFGKPFGFTLSNDSKVTDGDARLEILSVASLGAPYHSLKFYEIRTAEANTPGWQIRAYEWGFYVVAELQSTHGGTISVGSYGTTLKEGPRTISATVTDDNPGGPGPTPINAYLHSKIGIFGKYDSTKMTNTSSLYSGTTVSAVSGDTVYWFISVSDGSGNRKITPVCSYVIFKKRKEQLFIYNNATFSLANANLIYTGGSTDFDRWSSVSDGTGELAELLAQYQHILIGDGSFPARNVYTALHNRFKAATESAPIAVFFTSQDYGCYIEGACADTTFAVGAMEYDYFGVSKIGPQDLPPTNREFRVIPQADDLTDYLIKYNADSGTTLWHDPSFELSFSGYPDAMTPRIEAKSIFKDAGTNTIGVKYFTNKTKAVYLGFDAGALQFRSDTSLIATNDSKYAWIVDVGSLAIKFFQSMHVENVKNNNASYNFYLDQNYPNPFNPSTAIEYSIASRSAVTITVYNMLGQKVATLVNETKEPGSYQAEWNASRMASGLYFYEMRAGLYSNVKKMLLLK